ncbi:hypothetical protein PCANC_07101 [Puccinia coronata f. sp. avenae]|uniref:Uncharacterized protein n=1 Tax=Puccinia coronata f. sp. avenae TaxID=200324 RepID=A0A2N5VIR9_9BASI|nr:hypothetical protein PCANC_22677 [Puccinia coronata f. sp. avenae]PLW49897.1 hypothetical protein PCANC_07101 [Puccinia coronata f. sp. avenae]
MGADLAEEARTQVSAFPESINALKGLEQISLSSTPVREETPARGIIEKSIDGLKSGLNLMTSWPAPIRAKLGCIFSKVIQRIQAFFQSIRNKLGLEPTVIDQLAKDIIKNHLNEEYEGQRLGRGLEAKLKDSIYKLKYAFDELSVAEQRIARNYERISINIRPIIRNAEPGSDPVRVLGGKLIPSYAEALAEDRKKDQKYLSRIFGIMGPKNILEPWVKLAFKPKTRCRRLVSKVPGRYNFFWQLKRIQMDFAMVARLERLRGFSKATQDDEMIYKALQRKIRKREFKMAKYCGGHHELRIALDIIEDMDLHKTFMRVLSNPTEPDHFQFQFIEPWGRLREYHEIGDKKLIYSKLGIYQTEDNLKKIMKQGGIAWADIRWGMKSSAKITREEHTLMQMVTQEGFEKIFHDLKLHLE